MDAPRLLRDFDLSRMEASMRERSGAEVEALEMLERASLTLASVLEGAHVPVHPDPAPSDIHLKSAVLNLAVIVVRAARALATVVATGYVLEAHTRSSGASRRPMRALSQCWPTRPATKLASGWSTKRRQRRPA